MTTPLTIALAGIQKNPIEEASTSSLPACATAEIRRCDRLDDVVGSTSNSSLKRPRSPAVCRYFMRGICRFGSKCRFYHDNVGVDVNRSTNCERPSTSRRNWANAPAFVPLCKRKVHAGEIGETTNQPLSSFAASRARQNVDAALDVDISKAATINEECPSEWPCVYATHMERCEICNKFCLHPSNEEQRKKHEKECLQRKEHKRELTLAIERSKDKTCGICFDNIMERSGRDNRFGILKNCNHTFCLECIRKWRQSKQFEAKLTRSCPECRVLSDFYCPSDFWVETKEEKDKLLADYRKALGNKDCKYFKNGSGKCPFGNKCFYKHALPNGDLVDVGSPRKARQIHRRTNSELIHLLDVYMYECLVDDELYDISDDDLSSDDYVSSDFDDEDDNF